MMPGSSRNRRALLILAVWLGGVGIWVARETFVRERRTWREREAALGALEARRTRLQGDLAQARQARETLFQSQPQEFKELPEDQILLKGQDTILAAGHGAGLQGLRLKPPTLDPGQGWLAVHWTLDAEGPLGPWMDALDHVDAGSPHLEVEAFRISLGGDPWMPPVPGAEGPVLKGTLELRWTVSRRPR